jgi:hypothetical protein
VDFLWKTGRWGEFAMRWLSMGQKMQSKLSNPVPLLMGILDNPLKLDLCSIHLAKKKHSLNTRGQSKLWPSPYKDGVDDKYKKTFENRGKSQNQAYYLGCKRLEANCN